MTLKLMYITNNPNIAQIAEKSGVDWIFVDLEVNGKKERQGHLDTVISCHHIDDVKKIKEVLSTSLLLVRVNPIYKESKKEINKVIDNGADIIMLPFFHDEKEVKIFIKYVDQRAQICLLLETPEAVKNLDKILNIEGIDYIHIGLNDLHIGYSKKFMFELLSDGTVESLCKKIGEKNILYGFGGIAQLGQGALPSENIIAEHYRLSSSMAILSRSFCDAEKIIDINKIASIFKTGVSNIRKYESKLEKESANFFEENRNDVCLKIEKILKGLN
jgi:hypothetical protein